MANGWARDGAVQEQIDASVENSVRKARSRLPVGESMTHCEDCDAEIPEDRREAMKGVRLCVDCQSLQEAEDTEIQEDINRRGNKDSQLR